MLETNVLWQYQLATSEDDSIEVVGRLVRIAIANQTALCRPLLRDKHVPIYYGVWYVKALRKVAHIKFLDFRGCYTLHLKWTYCKEEPERWFVSEKQIMRFKNK